MLRSMKVIFIIIGTNLRDDDDDDDDGDGHKGSPACLGCSDGGSRSIS